MNVSRLVASVGGYFYSTSSDSIAVHLYGGNAATMKVGGHTVRGQGDEQLPVVGRNPAGDRSGCTCRVRTEAAHSGLGAKRDEHRVNGESVDVLTATKNGYLEIRRRWSSGDVVDLELPMPIERVYSHPNVKMDIGRTALKRGPLVYCAEQVDNPSARVRDIRLPRNAALVASERKDLFDGIVTVVAEGKAVNSDGWNDDLYRTAPPEESPTRWTAVPYYLWNNREPGGMLVWIPED